MAQKKKKLKDDEGYLGESKALTAEEISEKYTVPELKYILRENGLKVSGRKQELVERVLPILNKDLDEISEEQSDDSISLNDTVLAFTENEELLSSALRGFGVNYEDLSIKDRISKGEDTNLNINGFIQNGLSMSDSTMSIVAASDSSNVNLKLNVPEVSYTDFESTIFTFKNLDLFILPSSNPQSLEFSALMDSLEIITEMNYVNLKDLNLFFKAFPENNGIRLDIDINSFLYPDFNDTSINFEDLDFNLSIGLNEQNLNISVNLPKLTLLNKNYRVNLSDLNLNVVLNDLNLSDLDLSILMSDFHYTNFDDVHVDMDNVDVSLEHVFDTNNFDVIINMNSIAATGVTFDELFPMLNIDNIYFKNSTDDVISPINLIGHISPLDVAKMDIFTIGSLLSSGFDLDTYTRNMSSLYKTSIDVNAVGVSSADAPDSGLNLGAIFENFDYSSLDGIAFNLSGLIDFAGIDLAGFGIDVSDYDLSEIRLSEIMDILDNSDFDISAIKSMLRLFTLDSDNLDMSRLVTKFNAKKFDISALLASLNIPLEDVSGILDMLDNSGLDLGAIFENFDYSCLDGIVFNLSGLFDSAGIDLAGLGIDLSDIDLSAIRLSEIMGILNNFEFDMNSMASMLKLVGLDIEDLDLSGLIASFDTDNFDISSLLASLNLSIEDVSGILDMLNNSDLDFEAIFENFDYSCLDGIVLNLSGLIESAGIDLADLGIDVSDYDLSAISLADVIGILNNFEFDMASMASMLKVLGLDIEDLDLSGLIASFDTDNFDMSSLLASLNLSGEDISGIIEMFDNMDFDFASIFEDCDYSCLDAMVLDLSGLIESAGIDLADFGIDASDYDFSEISVPDLIGIINNPDYDMSEFDVSSLELDKLDVSGLIASFDADNFDISDLLASLNLSTEDISGIMEMFNNMDFDFAGIFENCDYSCLGAIELDLSGLIESTGIDLASLGIDLSDYDLSAINLLDVIGILNNFEFDMDSMASMLKLVGLDIEDLDLSGLIASFDADNFDISSLLAGLNLSTEDISGIMEMFNKMDFDFGSIFENCDYSCLGAIELDLSELIESTGIDLAGFGIDVSDYDLSAISLADVIGILNNFEFDMASMALMLKVIGLDIEDLDLSGLIASFDFENMDMSEIMANIDLSGLDISAISEMFENPEFDFGSMFENCDYSCLDAIELDLSGFIDSVGIDLAGLGIDVSGYDLSDISLADVIDILKNSEFIMSAMSAILNLFNLDWDELDMSNLIVSFDSENIDMSSLLTSLNVAGLDIESMLAMFDMYGFDISEFLNMFLGSSFMVNAPEDSQDSE